MKKYKVRDVVETTDEYGNRIFAIIGVDKDGYSAVHLKTGKRYNLTDDQIKRQTDRLPLDSPFLQIDPYDVEDGKTYCRSQRVRFPADAKKWNYLGSIIPGNEIKVIHRNFIHRAEFVRINMNKPRYPIRAKIEGYTYDFTLQSLVLPS